MKCGGVLCIAICCLMFEMHANDHKLQQSHTVHEWGRGNACQGISGRGVLGVGGSCYYFAICWLAVEMHATKAAS